MRRAFIVASRTRNDYDGEQINGETVNMNIFKKVNGKIWLMIAAAVLITITGIVFKPGFCRCMFHW